MQIIWRSAIFALAAIYPQRSVGFSRCMCRRCPGTKKPVLHTEYSQRWSDPYGMKSKDCINNSLGGYTA